MSTHRQVPTGSKFTKGRPHGTDRLVAPRYCTYSLDAYSRDALRRIAEARGATLSGAVRALIAEADARLPPNVIR
jgi:hypothetical protein